MNKDIGSRAMRVINSVRLPPDFTRKTSTRHRNYVPHPRPPLYTLPLSPRQSQCMDLICQGQTPKQIASHLSLNSKTVDQHLRQALAKLHARTLPEAAINHFLREHIHAFQLPSPPPQEVQPPPHHSSLRVSSNCQDEDKT